ncbi:MAG: caspase family protein [Burkholderiaceae bacterium]|nr:caspase family protein [Burkholderiaceae bacterium]
MRADPRELFRDKARRWSDNPHSEKRERATSPMPLKAMIARAAARAGLVCCALLAASGAWAGRYALVIGNNDYPGAPLRNAVNDARDLSAALRQQGFDVLLSENATRAGMFQAIREFGSRLREGDVALFFYAGHAIQLRDRNYLIPVDAKVQQEEDVTFYSLDVVEVLQRMDRARTRANVLILDACRDNPFSSTVRLSAVGLAQMSAPPGTLIAYATAPGQVAREGSGRNGVYTKHLLRHIGAPDLPVELLLKRVREGVFSETRGQQVPWDASSLRSDFVFAREPAVAATAQSSGAQPSSGQASGGQASSGQASSGQASIGQPSTGQPAGVQSTSVPSGAPAVATIDLRLSLEKTFWESIKDSRSTGEFEAYLAQFPEGVFAALARARLDNLKRGLAEAAVATSRAPQPAPGGATTLPEWHEERYPPATQLAADTSRSSATAAAADGADAARDPSTLAPIALADGSRYQGRLRDASPDGRGRLVSPTMGTYVGDFVRGVREGAGEQSWPNGDRYSGNFVADRPHGIGVMSFANGDRYEGNFVAGSFSGSGKLSLASGYRYEGEFVAGKRQGKGSAVFAAGNRYSGEFRDDKASGNGVIEFTDGGRFEGSVVDGLPQGKGVQRFADGSRYQGEFRAGKMSGLGTYDFPNGDRHEGMFDDGVADGPGVRFFAAGGRFEGVFANRGSAAAGSFVDANGARRPGKLVNGVFREEG